MKRSTLTALIVMCAGSLAIAQPPSKDPKATAPAAPGKTTAGQPEKKPANPGGMSEADMAACMAAATPGPQHAHLAESVGTWTGKCKMWMAPGEEPTTSDCTTTITSIMGGRYTHCEVKGDMPGMGPFEGSGVYGFDNVTQKYVRGWIDNMGTGIMTGTGELSADGKTMTWTCTYNCPIQKKPVTMKEIERHTGKDTVTLEMYGPDPKTGKEYKMMEINSTRTAGAAPTPAKTTDTVKPTR